MPFKRTVRSKEELINEVVRCNPGDILCLEGTTYSLTISDQIHAEYLTEYGNKSKRYKTNLDFLLAKIKRTPMKLWR